MGIPSFAGIEKGHIYTTDEKDLWVVEEIISQPVIVLKNLKNGAIRREEAGSSNLKDFARMVKEKTAPPEAP